MNIVVDIGKLNYEEQIFNKHFERFDLVDYPAAPFWADIWTHTFKTDYTYGGVTIYRNKLTKSEIDCPHIVKKSDLE